MLAQDIGGAAVVAAVLPTEADILAADRALTPDLVTPGNAIGTSTGLIHAVQCLLGGGMWETGTILAHLGV